MNFDLFSFWFLLAATVFTYVNKTAMTRVKKESSKRLELLKEEIKKEENTSRVLEKNTFVSRKEYKNLQDKLDVIKLKVLHFDFTLKEICSFIKN